MSPWCPKLGNLSWLSIHEWQEKRRANELVNAKQVTARADRVVQLAKPTVPVRDHPWRRYVIKPNVTATSPETKNRSYPQVHRVFGQWRRAPRPVDLWVTAEKQTAGTFEKADISILLKRGHF